MGFFFFLFPRSGAREAGSYSFVFHAKASLRKHGSHRKAPCESWGSRVCSSSSILAGCTLTAGAHLTRQKKRQKKVEDLYLQQRSFDRRAVKTGKRQEASLPVIIPYNLCPQPITPGSGGRHHTPQPCQSADMLSNYYLLHSACRLARDLRLDPNMPASAAGLTRYINTKLTAKSDRRRAAQHETWFSADKMWDLQVSTLSVSFCLCLDLILTRLLLFFSCLSSVYSWRVSSGSSLIPNCHSAVNLVARWWTDQ